MHFYSFNPFDNQIQLVKLKFITLKRLEVKKKTSAATKVNEIQINK